MWEDTYQYYATEPVLVGASKFHVPVNYILGRNSSVKIIAGPTVTTRKDFFPGFFMSLSCFSVREMRTPRYTQALVLYTERGLMDVHIFLAMETPIIMR